MDRVYLAGALYHKEFFKALADKLESTGRIQITARWFDLDPVDISLEQNLADRAIFDLDGVDKANKVIALLPANNGTHVEIGYALAKHKDIYLIDGPEFSLPKAPSKPAYPCVFHYHPGITSRIFVDLPDNFESMTLIPELVSTPGSDNFNLYLDELYKQLRYKYIEATILYLISRW